MLTTHVVEDHLLCTHQNLMDQLRIHNMAAQVNVASVTKVHENLEVF